MFWNQQIVYKRHSPQAVRSALGTVVTPSHVVSQLVAFPGDILMVFPGQGEHKSPFLKYPDWQTGKNRNIGRIFRTKGCARFCEFWLFFMEQVFTLPLQYYEKSNQGAQKFAHKSAKRAHP